MGDWVKHVRARRWAEMQTKTNKILRDRGVENKADVSPSVAIPLIAAAINEDRDVLKDLWARLLAAAMDPARSDRVHPSMIALLKNMDPLDVRVLFQVRISEGSHPLATSSSYVEHLSEVLGASRDEAWFSLEHLFDLRCLNQAPADIVGRPGLTARAKLLLKAVSD